ncbi:MAG: amidase [Solirubrobacterales bacterium]|nr:amidase [Solirubrobacterales bacterium]
MRTGQREIQPRQPGGAAGGGPARALTERSAVDLAAAIRAGELRARDVVDAHIEAIERDNAHLNAVVATRFERARAEAEAADARVTAAGAGEELPPLLGVPCTIKESYAVEDMPHTSGSADRAGVVAERSATVVARLMDAGAIPLGVTNTSELTMWIEAQNPVYGRTENAYDPRRTAGGSSGGEGAAIGAGFAPIGLGSDIGGSIRIPAFFNGVFGHKPTGRVVPHTGHYPFPNERGSALLGCGPLARRAADLMPVLRAIAGPDGEDSTVRAVELGDPAAVSIEGLRVAISDDVTVWPVSQELRNARIHAAKALRAAGAEVRRITLPGLKSAIEPYMNAIRESGGLRELLTEGGAKVPGFGRLIADAVRGRSRYTNALLITLAAENLSAHMPARLERRALTAERALAEEVVDAVGDGVLLHPPFSRVAPRHGRTVGRPWVLAPTALFNLVGLPATEVPLGLGERGLPLGVQVAAGRDRDHVAIAVALELERAFGGWVPPGRH